MHAIEPPCISSPTDSPRHPQQEIADLLARALLRLHGQTLRHGSDALPDTDTVALGLGDQQRLNGNSCQHQGVRQ